MEQKDAWLTILPILISSAALVVSIWVAVRAESVRPRAEWRLRIDGRSQNRDLGYRLMVEYDVALINIGSAAATDIEVWPLAAGISVDEDLSGTTVRAGEHTDLRICFPLTYNGGTGRESYGPNFDIEGSQLVVTYRDTPQSRKLKKKVLRVSDFVNRPPRM